MKSVLLTGASGFIGCHLTELFLSSAKYDINLLVRKKNSAIDEFERRGAKVIIGNFESEASLRSAVQDKDIIIHNAGATKAFKEQDYIKINAEYTKNILNLLNKNQKFILISSQAAVGPSALDTPVREKDNLRCPVSYYGKSKLLAEDYVTEWGTKNDNNYIIIRPCSVFGPGDKEMLPFFKSIYRHMETIVTGGVQKVSLIYVKDLVKAIFKAVETDKKGEAYFACNDELYDTKDLGIEIKKALGMKFVIKLKIPIWLLSLIVFFTDRFSKEPLLLNAQKVIEFRQKAWLVSNEKIKKDLNWRPDYSLEKAVKETTDWLLANKQL